MTRKFHYPPRSYIPLEIALADKFTVHVRGTIELLPFCVHMRDSISLRCFFEKKERFIDPLPVILFKAESDIVKFYCVCLASHPGFRYVMLSCFMQSSYCYECVPGIKGCLLVSSWASKYTVKSLRNWRKLQTDPQEIRSCSWNFLIDLRAARAALTASSLTHLSWASFK